MGDLVLAVVANKQLQPARITAIIDPNPAPLSLGRLSIKFVTLRGSSRDGIYVNYKAGFGKKKFSSFSPINDRVVKIQHYDVANAKPVGAWWVNWMLYVKIPERPDNYPLRQELENVYREKLTDLLNEQYNN